MMQSVRGISNVEEWKTCRVFFIPLLTLNGEKLLEIVVLDI